MHEFELADGRKIGYPDDEYAPDLVWLDHIKLRVTREVKPGDRFTYTFDFGDSWEHRCVVEREKADPVEERLSEYRCCLGGLRHFWDGSRIRWG